MKRRASLYLEEILQAIEAMERFTEGKGLGEFQEDDKTASAVLRKLEIIGEAAKPIPEEMRSEAPIYPGAPWPP